MNVASSDEKRLVEILAKLYPALSEDQLTQLLAHINQVAGRLAKPPPWYAVQLKAARVNAGLTQPQVAAQFEWSVSKITRIENGDVPITLVDLNALIEMYGITSLRLIKQLHESAAARRQQKD